MKTILDGRSALAQEINQIAEVASYLWKKGWAERNGGNITVNITEYVDAEMKQMPAISQPMQIGCVLPMLKNKYFYCKGTGKRMRDLARNPMQNGSIIRFLDDCASYEIIADECVKPTSELPSHLMLHNHLIETGTDYKASIHTHPIELVAMSHNKRFLDSKEITQVLWSMIPETLAFAPLALGVVPYEMPSSVKLAEATLEQVKKDNDVVLWEKHGVVSVAPNIMEAFDQIDVLNKSACIYMCAKNMGFEPEGMTPESMTEIQEVFSLPKKRKVIE